MVREYCAALVRHHLADQVDQSAGMILAAYVSHFSNLCTQFMTGLVKMLTLGISRRPQGKLLGLCVDHILLGFDSWLLCPHLESPSWG